MGFKSHRIRLLALILLEVISAILLGWALSYSRMHLVILLVIVLSAETVMIYMQLTKWNREILFFFRALENDDTSFVYDSSHRGRYIDELHQHLNRLNDRFREMRLNNEMREQYFSQILEHLSSGLMVISRTGHVNHINEEALRLLNLPQLTHARALSQKYSGLYARIKELKSLDRAEIGLLDRETGLKRIIGLQVVDINLKGEEVRVLTLQDLSPGMERKEIDDWIRLIRLMSHEIMNSLAPITSISTTLGEVWAEQIARTGAGNITEATIQQTVRGLEAIAEQSEGLTTFFESYRVLSRMPDPVKKEVPVCALFEKLETLVAHYREEISLRLSFDCSHPDLVIEADEQMIIQVMLNLVKNAVQAVEKTEDPEITVSAAPKENRIILEVSDNGEGISPEISDEIFMPFFTTRKMGTGVGLSYSRQVMAMNGGRIEFDSRPGRTQFRLIF